MLGNSRVEYPLCDRRLVVWPDELREFCRDLLARLAVGEHDGHVLGHDGVSSFRVSMLLKLALYSRLLIVPSIDNQLSIVSKKPLEACVRNAAVSSAPQQYTPALSETHLQLARKGNVDIACPSSHCCAPCQLVAFEVNECKRKPHGLEVDQVVGSGWTTGGLSGWLWLATRGLHRWYVYVYGAPREAPGLRRESQGAEAFKRCGKRDD